LIKIINILASNINTRSRTGVRGGVWSWKLHDNMKSSTSLVLGVALVCDKLFHLF